MREVVNLYHLMRNGDFQRSNQESPDLQMTSIWAPPAKANTIILLDIRSIAITASNPMRMGARRGPPIKGFGGWRRCNGPDRD